MSYLDEIMKRAQDVTHQASKLHQQSMEQSQKITEQMRNKMKSPVDAGSAAQPESAQCTDDTQRQTEPSGQAAELAQVYNYISIDNINGRPMAAFRQENSKKRKGILAPNVEIILLEPGHYEITAHGITYQTSPAVVAADLDAGKYYCLGAAEDGLYIEERPYEWTL